MVVNDTGNTRCLADAVHLMRTRWPDLNNNAPSDSPVFVLAAGWRSGSTLLQRMLMPECMIWGEPYGHACMLEHLAEPLRCMTNDWPEPHFFLNDEERDCLTEQFVANLFPSVKSLVESHRAYFETMFVKPAHETGTDRWGFKEVRLSADYAHYLKLLYPDSKFLFLIRNPYDAYRSWAARRNADWKWFYRWPDQPVTARERRNAKKRGRGSLTGFPSRRDPTPMLLTQMHGPRIRSSDKQRASAFTQAMFIERLNNLTATSTRDTVAASGKHAT